MPQDQFLRQDVVAEQDLEVKGDVTLGDSSNDAVIVSGVLSQGDVVGQVSGPTAHGPGPLTDEVLYSFQASSYRGGTFVVQLVDSVNDDFYQATFGLVHDGVSAFLSSASVIADGWGGTNPTFSAAINGLDVELRCTTADSISYSSIVKAELYNSVLGPEITIAIQPANASVAAPAPANPFVSAATNDGGTLSYQWEVDDGMGWANATGGVYSGDTTSILTITDSTGLNGYQYRVVISSSATASPVTSSAMTLTVT